MTLLHELVESTVDQRPDEPAVCTTDAAVTYAELDAAANRIAGNLVREFGVGVGDLVAVASPSSPSMIEAILGVLKAGAGYVPVDPDYLENRIEFVLADSGAKLVLADEVNLARFTSLDVPAVAIEAVAADGPSSRPAATGVGPADLAYVIYTSGSTGRPKGVAVEHRQIVASTLARLAHYDRAPETYALLFPPAFDGAVGVIYWAQLTGGCLYLPAKIVDSTASDLLWAGGINRPVTDICCVPSLYQFILDHARPHELAGLRRVIVAAEVCRPSLVERHFQLAPQADIHNEYGPTEAAVWTTVHDCVERTPRVVPIGRPISSATVEVSDEQSFPLPDGSVGELIIGGQGIARGYLNSPALTAERFVPDPAATGRRRYRTGDLVRRHQDGELEFHGRNDEQLKWNGYRIEPGEIETNLSHLPEVLESAIVVNESDTGRPALVAFVQPAAGVAIDAEALTARLRRILPEFMVPTRVVELAGFPRTVNGKVDRAALTRRVLPALFTKDDRSQATADDLEERIRSVVAEVMQQPDVPLDAHFFRLGADSLTFMKIAATATQRGVAMSVKDVFRAPTVTRLAQLLRGSGTAEPPTGRR